MDAVTGLPVLDGDGLPVPTFAPMVEVSGPLVSDAPLQNNIGLCYHFEILSSIRERGSQVLRV